MKKNFPFVVVPFLVLVSLCFAEAQQEKKASGGVNKAMEDRIIALEKQAWESYKQQAWDTLGSLLADDCVFVGDDGIKMGKSESMKVIKENLNPLEYRIEEPKVVEITKDTAQITYKLWASVDHGNYSFDSTVWVRRNGKWLAILHQATPEHETATK